MKRERGRNNDTLFSINKKKCFCAVVQLAVLTRASMKKGLDDDDLGSSNEKAFAKKNGTAHKYTDSGVRRELVSVNPYAQPSRL